MSTLGQYTWLEHTSRPSTFHDWLESINLSLTQIESSSGFEYLGFEHFFMLIKAAIDGLGFGLVPKFLVEKELSTGQLINPAGIRYNSQLSYYLLYPKYTRKEVTIRQFYDWLKSDALDTL